MMEKDKERYLISILGEQTLDGETDKIEVLTAGNFMKRRDHFYIGYKEYDEENPETFYDNLIKVEGDMVTIDRKGPMQSQLLLQKGKRFPFVADQMPRPERMLIDQLHRVLRFHLRIPVKVLQ